MKKLFFILFLFLSFIFVQPSHAVKHMTWTTLSDADGTAMSSYSLTSSLKTTSAISNSSNVGFSSLLLTVTGGQMDVDYQLSYDAINWFTPYTTDGTSLTAAGSVVSNLTASRWVVLPYRAAPYIRFIFYKDNNATFSAYYLQQQDQ